jgi:hypothetical protein
MKSSEIQEEAEQTGIITCGYDSDHQVEASSSKLCAFCQLFVIHFCILKCKAAIN